MRTAYAAIVVGALALLAGCSDADIASRNLSQAADQFEINRRVLALLEQVADLE